jgi:hypothetical protein
LQNRQLDVTASVGDDGHVDLLVRLSDDAAGVAMLVAGTSALGRRGGRRPFATALALGVAAATWFAAPRSWGLVSTAFLHRGLIVVVVASSVHVWQRADLRAGRVLASVCTLAAVGFSIDPTWANRPWAAIPAAVLAALAWRRRPAAPEAIAVAGMLSMTALVIDANSLELLGRQVRAIGYAWSITVTALAVAAARLRRWHADRIVEIGRHDRRSPAAGDLDGWRIGFADHDGRYRSWTGVLVSPEQGDSSTVVRLDDGLPDALVVHRGRSLDDPAVRRALVSGLRLLATNVRLAREIDLESEAVAVSRARLAGAERQAAESLATDVQREVLPHLDRIGELLAAVSSPDVPEASAMLLTVRNELLGLVDDRRRTGPVGTALRTLAVRGLVDVSVDDELDDPAFDLATGDRRGALELAYSAASEGVANALKHSRASRIKVSAWPEADGLVIEVDDDGRGGAIVAEGGGLAGLGTRVQAAGGAFEVTTRQGGGTTLVARLPVRNDRSEAQPAVSTRS